MTQICSNRACQALGNARLLAKTGRGLYEPVSKGKSRAMN